MLAAAGIVLLSPSLGGGLDALGVALALVAGAFWAAYIVLSARIGRAFPGGDGLALAMLVAAALLLIPRGRRGRLGDLLDPSVLAIGFAVADAELGDPVLARARGAATTARRARSAC